MSRRIVVTGAAGFVAAATVRSLVAGGHEVLAWVRPTTDLARLAPLAAAGRLQVLRLDLDSLRDAARRSEALAALREFRPEALLHAAWSGVRGAARDAPAQVDNLTAAFDALRLAAEAGASRFVGVGSQAEYGPQRGIVDEATVPAPDTLYGAAKLACGQVALALAARLGLSAAWARLFSVYGPGERSGAVVPELARALRAGRPFPLGPAATRWDFLYEDDAGDALAALTLRPAAGTFNVASGAAVPLGDVFARIRDLASPGADLLLGARPPSPRDLPRLEASVAKLTGATGWTPRTPLADGLARTVEAILAEAPLAPTPTD